MLIVLRTKLQQKYFSVVCLYGEKDETVLFLTFCRVKSQDSAVSTTNYVESPRNLYYYGANNHDFLW